MNEMKRKEYARPHMECVELTTAAILAASNALEISDDVGDDIQPILSPTVHSPNLWESDKE